MNYFEFLLPTGMAVLLGGAIGLERQIRVHAAGLRTHMLVSLSAAIFVLACETMYHFVDEVERRHSRPVG